MLATADEDRDQRPERKGIDELRDELFAELWTIPEVKQILDKDRSTIFRYIHEGKLASTPFGGRTYVTEDSLRRLMQSLKDKATKDAAAKARKNVPAKARRQSKPATKDGE